MKVISVNVGLPRTVQWKGKAVSTGIFKAPVSGRIHSRTLNFDGDRQADLSVHGAGPVSFGRKPGIKFARVPKRKKSSARNIRHRGLVEQPFCFIRPASGRWEPTAIWCRALSRVLTEQAEDLRKAADDGGFAAARRRCRGYACSRRSSVRVPHRRKLNSFRLL